MTTRPRSHASPPSPDEIRAARDAAGLTQSACARLIYVTERAFRMYEAGDRRMHPAQWELLALKLATLKTLTKLP